MAGYQIFADTTADLCPEMLAGLPPVRFIPMEVDIGGRRYLYGPGGDLTVEAFYALQRAGNFASTTQIAPETFTEWFEPVLAAGQDLIYFPLTSGLSGTYQSACLSMEELRQRYPERTILCVDSFCASVGQGFLVREIARKAAEGLTAAELAAWVQANSRKVCHWFTVDVFDHLKHGGRVSAAAAVVGTALQIKPMLHVNNEGRLEVAEKPRGRKNAMAAQMARMNADWLPEMGKLVVIGHGDDVQAVEQLKAEVLAAHPDAEVFIAPIGPVIGAHTGPGMLALIYWGNNR